MAGADRRAHSLEVDPSTGVTDIARRTQLALALSLAALLPSTLAAQAPTADVSGVVQDPGGHPLPGVVVRASGHATGFTYRASSASTGRYWLTGLPPGRYDLTAERIGLRPVTFRDVILPVGGTIELDFTLRPSPLEVEPITVSVGAPSVETTSSDISYVLDRRRVERLPVESRHFVDLARLVPGATLGTVSTGGPPPFGTDGTVVGALNRQSSGIVVDGGDFTETVFGDLGGSLPLLAIQEIEVVQAGYSADLGRAASGIVNVATRSGGNDPLIEGFGLYRHHALNARGAFEAEKPDFDRSHWGIAAGGPIAVDRTHFFAAFERRVENAFSTVNTGGAFHAYEGTFRTPLTDNLLFVRLDHQAGANHDLTLRYAAEIGEQLFGVGGDRALEYGRNNTVDMHSGLLAHRWTPADGWLNEARLHVISTRRALDRNSPPGPTLEYPSLKAGPHHARQRVRGVRVELRNDLSWIAAGPWGTHRLKVGAHLGRQQNEVDHVVFERGLFVFPSDTASAPAFAIVNLGEAVLRLDASNVQLAFYVRDDWDPLPGLSLDLGLRYDVETNGSNQGFVSPFAGELPVVRPTPRPVDKDNLAPRIGIAWDPTGEGRTVVRGGFGVFYDALLAGPLVGLERSSGVRTARIANPGTTAVEDLVIDPDDVLPTVWTSGEIETSMTRQYSVGVAHRFAGGVVVRVDGLLVQGRDLLLQRDLNPVDPEEGPRYPGFASVFLTTSQGRAEAKMLLVEARKEFTRGWLDVGYTLADRKNTTDARGELVPQTDPGRLDLDAEWGPAAWDERHRLVVTGGVELPFGLDLVANATYASARPFTAITGTNDNGDFSRENDRPPGEGRNARRGPDFFRTDLGLRWRGATWGRSRIGLELNVYNLFDRTNYVASSVQNELGLPLFGRPLEAFPGRQAELGIEVRWE